MKFYYIYRIDNLLNGQYYIGMHSTKNLDDGYFGSGLRLKRSIAKYGKENFRLTILEFCDSAEEMFLKEAQHIGDKFKTDPQCLNLMEGGKGGWEMINKNISPAQRAHLGLVGGNKIREMRIINPELDKRIRQANSVAGKLRFSNVEFRRRHAEHLRKHQTKAITAALSEESRTKRKNTFKQISHQQGASNSQFGTMWIYNLVTNESKKISKTEAIPAGWAKGRKMQRKG